MSLPPFITTADLSDRLGRDVTADPGATSAVDSACQICRTVAEQDFTGGTATIVLDGTGTDALVLPQRPVGTVSAVTVNGGTVTDWALSAQGLLFRGSAGGWWSGGSWSGFSGAAWVGFQPVWPAGRQNVSVTYSYGYPTLGVPSDVCEVALQLAMRLVVQGVASQETVGGVSVNYGMSADDLTKNELRILQRYRGARSF